MSAAYRDAVRVAAQTSDWAFARYMKDLVFPPHLRDAETFANRHGSALILMPRGHAKTELFVHRAARLVGLTKGRVRIIVATAVSEDAEARSGAIRALVESERFAEVFAWARNGVKGSDWTDAHWSIAGTEALHGKDYTCRAVGLLSVRAGPRCDILLADDLVGLQENATEGMRKKASTTYWSVIDPMVVPDSPALRAALADNPRARFPTGADGSVAGLRWFLGTRWHEADIYAELIRKGWPALVRTATQADGSSLWPNYWTPDKLAAKKLDLGTAIYNLQYQNDPSGMGGNIFKRDWFQYVDHVPDGARSLGMDLAASSKERSDYTAVTEWVEDSDHNLYLVGAWRKRLDEGHRGWLTGVYPEGHPDAGKPDSSQSDGPRLLWPTDALPPGWVGQDSLRPAARSISALNIESSVFQFAFTREILANTRLPARAVYPDHDKVTRSRPLAARYEGGKVFHLRGAPGIEDYEMEAVGFPNGRHDDLVDAAVYGADLNGANEFSFGSVRLV
jgi:hypothetical protein